MTDSTDVSDVKMTRFGNRVYLFRKRHVRVKDEAKIARRRHVVLVITAWKYHTTQLLLRSRSVGLSELRIRAYLE